MNYIPLEGHERTESAAEEVRVQATAKHLAEDTKALRPAPAENYDRVSKEARCPLLDVYRKGVSG